MRYTMVCSEGHDPETLTVEAENEEMALQMMKDKAKAHNSEKHPGMMDMLDEDMESFIKSNWTK